MFCIRNPCQKKSLFLYYHSVAIVTSIVLQVNQYLNVVQTSLMILITAYDTNKKAKLVNIFLFVFGDVGHFFKRRSFVAQSAFLKQKTSFIECGSKLKKNYFKFTVFSSNSVHLKFLSVTQESKYNPDNVLQRLTILAQSHRSPLNLPKRNTS